MLINVSQVTSVEHCGEKASGPLFAEEKQIFLKNN